MSSSAIRRRRLIIAAKVLIAGAVVLAAMATVPSYFLRLQVVGVTSRIRADMRSLGTRIESYFADHGAYPNAVLLRTYARNDRELIQAGGGRATTLPAAMTTPTAYITSLFSDPCAPGINLPHAYHTDGPGWILYSPGVDCDYDIVPTEDYDGSTSQPGPRLLLKTYDPTNGITSGGDVWRVRQ